LNDFKPRDPLAPKYKSSHFNRHPSRRRRNYILSRTDVEMTIRVKARVWSDQTNKKWTLFRVHKNGTIFVQHYDDESWWIPAYETDLSYRQEQQIRYICWGSAVMWAVYRTLSEVPRMSVGMRFWIRGEPENDGLWELVDYFHSAGGVRITRLLPNYFLWSMNRFRRINGVPWIRRYHDCKECFPD